MDIVKEVKRIKTRHFRSSVTSDVSYKRAIELATIGWAVFPVHSVDAAGRCSCRKGSACPDAGKHPRVTGWETEATTDSTKLRRWASKWSGCNWGVATGPAMLVVIDTDPGRGGDESDVALQHEHAPLPETPTVETGGGGVHRYFLALPGVTIGNSQDRLAPGIDIRGTGGFVVAPGSLHKSGRRYAWRDGLSPSEVPVAELPAWVVNLLGRDCYRDTEDTERLKISRSSRQLGRSRRALENTSLSRSLDLSVTPPLDDVIDALIHLTLPAQHSQRNNCIFEFARGLKAMPYFAGAKASVLRGMVRRWHSKALPFIATKEFTDTWAAFTSAWKDVRHPHGADPLSEAMTRAREAGIPVAAQDYDDCPKTQWMIALCRELQRMAGDNPFFLGCRDAARLSGFGNDHMTASRRLAMLCDDEVLELKEKGRQTLQGGRSSRYRYLLPLEESRADAVRARRSANVLVAN